jgi:serine/threonine protein kinase/tetratricopeptide (TPR) repeat protein
MQLALAPDPASRDMTGEKPTTPPPTPGSRSQPSRIGPYRILEVIGEGGMGIVYLAEQAEPIRRRVAVKVIKIGMDTREVVARFEAERQALAMMDHPNIARVIEAGASEDGRPYFVMEYVAGVPITEYCDKVRLSTADRLALFLPVCAAVQHAHQKGVIHRDLKPSNVLVTVQDGQAVPKVIDFGVAKATRQRLTEKTVFTQHGLIIGTPEYMSPEQAEMSGLDVDTRADIYSLGAMLYELLAGALPFDPDTLRKAGYAEIQRIIREQEPARPSTRVSTMGATAGEVAARRRTDGAALAKQLRGDLDWITMKALEKDPGRRYASASELAADIGRHLHDEPVVASPPSLTYRMRKLAHKHKGPVIAGGFVAVVLLVGVIASSVLYIRAERARALAEGEALRNRLETDTFAAFIEDADVFGVLGKQAALPRYLPLARELLALQRRTLKQTDPERFVANLYFHAFIVGDVRNVSPDVARFQVEVCRDLVEAQSRSLDRNPASATKATLFIKAVADCSRKTNGGDTLVERLLREALSLWSASNTGDDSTIQRAEFELERLLWDRARALLEEGKATTAEPALREALALLRKRPARNRLDELQLQRDLGRSLMLLHRYQDAEPILLQCEAGFARDWPGLFPQRREIRSWLAVTYEAMGQADKAQQFRQPIQ